MDNTFDPEDVDRYFCEEEVRHLKLKIAWLEERIEAEQETITQLEHELIAAQAYLDGLKDG